MMMDWSETQLAHCRIWVVSGALCASVWVVVLTRAAISGAVAGTELANQVTAGTVIWSTAQGCTSINFGVDAQQQVAAGTVSTHNGA